MSNWRDIHADQNLRLAQKMLQQQGEINALKATVGRVEKVCRDIEVGASAMRIDPPHWVTSVRCALRGPESNAAAPSPVSAATEAHSGAGEAQEGSDG
jgi:hypothetical protein